MIMMQSICLENFQELGDDIDGNIVTIFPDDNKKYLSTELVNNIDLNPDFISNQIELLNIEFI